MDSNLTCQQRHDLGNPLPLPTTTANALRYIQITFYIICYPTALLLNAFVIFIVARFKQLHTTTFYFALQIIVANLVNIVVYSPYSTANAIANRDVFAQICPVMGFLISFFQTSRSILMFVLVVDRFCLIFLPFWYGRHRVKVVIPLSIVGWMLALVLSLVPVVRLRSCYTLQRFTWVCTIGNGCDNMPQCNAYLAFRVTLANIGNLIAFFLYLLLYCKARKLQNSIAILPENENLNESRQAMAEFRKSERRANATFLLLFTALVGVTLPSYVFFILARAALRILNISRPPTVYTIISVLLGSLFLLIFILDPIVIMRNKDVRGVVKDVRGVVKDILERLRRPSTSSKLPMNKTSNK